MPANPAAPSRRMPADPRVCSRRTCVRYPRYSDTEATTQRASGSCGRGYHGSALLPRVRQPVAVAAEQQDIRAPINAARLKPMHFQRDRMSAPFLKPALLAAMPALLDQPAADLLLVDQIVGVLPRPPRRDGMRYRRIALHVLRPIHDRAPRHSNLRRDRPVPESLRTQLARARMGGLPAAVGTASHPHVIADASAAARLVRKRLPHRPPTIRLHDRRQLVRLAEQATGAAMLRAPPLVMRHAARLASPPDRYRAGAARDGWPGSTHPTLEPHG